MSVWSDKDFFSMLEKGVLYITPLIRNNIQPASIDLTLDENIMVPIKGNRIDVFDPRKIFEDSFTKETIKDEGYILHHGEMICANTVEHLKLSSLINGKLYNRNSLARIGINAVCGNYINPGFEGKIPLVIYNNGPFDITLRKGMRICQLEISWISSESIRSYDHRHNINYFDFLDKKIKEEEIAKGNLDTSLAEFLEKSIQKSS